MSTYGSRLQAALERKKASKTDLAKAIGRTPQAVGQVINGTTKALTAENNSLAAIYLGVNPHWLATGEGEMLPADGRSAEAANVAPAQPAGLGATLANLGELLSRTSPQTRAAVADLLGRYAQDPDSSQSLAQAIELLVKADQSKKAGA